jgi:creatinine amidohydrolase/Fe(II)-dependent formamide hydrolase-like protein
MIALVPVGATEQHGPYLALAADRLAANHVAAHRLAQAVARRLYPKADRSDGKQWVHLR